MPGKQMAIDADLNAGLINESQARSRREQIARDSEFYGAMDGAARFNQRDAIATILITAINLVCRLLLEKKKKWHKSWLLCPKSKTITVSPSMNIRSCLA